MAISIIFGVLSFDDMVSKFLGHEMRRKRIGYSSYGVAFIVK